MGAYAECWLESLYVGSTKYDYDRGLMQLFRASDKRIRRSTVKDLPKPVHQWTQHVEDPKEKFNVVYYTAAATLIKARLELKGYTLDTAKRAFVKRVRAEAKEYPDAIPEMKEYYENRANFFKELDVDKWVETLRHIKDKSVGIPQWDTSDYRKEMTLEDFILQNDWYGFPGVDLFVPLRLVLETAQRRTA